MASQERIPFRDRSNETVLRPSPDLWRRGKSGNDYELPIRKCCGEKHFVGKYNEDVAAEGCMQLTLASRTVSENALLGMENATEERGMQVSVSAQTPPLLEGAVAESCSAVVDSTGHPSMGFRRNATASSVEAPFRLISAAIDGNSSLPTPPCVSVRYSNQIGGEATPTGNEIIMHGHHNRKRRHNSPMSCPPFGIKRLESSAERILQKSRVGQCYTGKGFDHFSSAETSMNKQVKASKRRRSLPVMNSKVHLPDSFVDAQKSYFAEVDAFELEEEEVGSEEK
eukprot:c19863_g1_i3 orf=177-1025(+)